MLQNVDKIREMLQKCCVPNLGERAENTPGISGGIGKTAQVEAKKAQSCKKTGHLQENLCLTCKGESSILLESFSYRCGPFAPECAEWKKPPGKKNIPPGRHPVRGESPNSGGQRPPHHEDPIAPLPARRGGFG